MQTKSSFLLISTFLLLLTAKGCHSKLQCYVCDHCSSITTSTQLETCDESFFNSGGTELPSTMTTTEMTKDTTMTPMVDTTTTTPGESSSPSTSTTTTTMMMTTTTEGASENTTEKIDNNTSTTVQPPVPTPPTMSALETTTALPTPPLLGTMPSAMEQMPISSMDTLSPTMEQHMSTSGVAMPEQNMQVMAAADQMMNMTTNSTGTRDYMNSSDFRVRQARHVTPANSDMMSYHCYTLQLRSNNTISTQRGCARVLTSESVCGKLEMLATNDTSIKKCKYCSTNRCNGSSALNVSAIAVLVALVASFLKN